MSSTAQIFAKEQVEKARLLFAVGMEVDPQHGPLYHAYGNMEMVNHYYVLHNLLTTLSGIRTPLVPEIYS